jgi:small-conductance mechanosensitive channel
MRSSSIRTDDNLLIILPNSEFVTKPFSNLTASGPKLRTSIFIPVAHKANPQDVIRILLEIADGHPDVLKSPAPSVILAELRPHAAMFTLLVWTKIVPADFAILRSGLNLAVADRFRQANIELPRAYMGPVEVGLEPVCGVH